MIVAKLKPEEEIFESLGQAQSILVLGCGGCTSVCYTGGLRETDELAAVMSHMAKKAGRKIKTRVLVMERQCEAEFLDDIRQAARDVDAILSLGCGAGVQLLAEELAPLPVLPALNTLFIGSTADYGTFEERCRSCGDCQLAWTGGICPVTRCPKGIFNGPCGGSENERCEVNPENPCAWCEIYNRLKDQGRLDAIMKVREPVLWQNQKQQSFSPREKKKK